PVIVLPTAATVVGAAIVVDVAGLDFTAFLVVPPREKASARPTTSPTTSTAAMARVRRRALRCAASAACWRASRPDFLRSRLAEGTGGQGSRAWAMGRGRERARSVETHRQSR